METFAYIYIRYQYLDMEMMVGPSLHTQKGLGVEEVVQIILNERKLFQQQLSSIEVGIVLYVSNQAQGIVYNFIPRENSSIIQPSAFSRIGPVLTVILYGSIIILL